jgi:ABC-type transporter lipoprotein component MlaA
VWGVNSGPYLVIPFLGPSTARDAPARLVDPGWYLGYKLDNATISWSLWALNEIQIRASLSRPRASSNRRRIDRYSFIRDAWFSRRRNLVYDGSPPAVKEERIGFPFRPVDRTEGGSSMRQTVRLAIVLLAWLAAMPAMQRSTCGR